MLPPTPSRTSFRRSDFAKVFCTKGVPGACICMHWLRARCYKKDPKIPMMVMLASWTHLRPSSAVNLRCLQNFGTAVGCKGSEKVTMRAVREQLWLHDGHRGARKNATQVKHLQQHVFGGVLSHVKCQAHRRRFKYFKMSAEIPETATKISCWQRLTRIALARPPAFPACSPTCCQTARNRLPASCYSPPRARQLAFWARKGEIAPANGADGPERARPGQKHHHHCCGMFHVQTRM